MFGCSVTAGDFMKIGQINCNRDWGGGENQILHLAQALAARGEDVVLLAHPQGELLRRALDCGLNAEPLPLLFGRPSVRRTAGLVKRLGLDLLHVHDSPGGRLGAAVGRRLDLPVILSRRVASPIRRNFASQRKYTATNFAAVIAISNTVKDVFLSTCSYPADRVFTVPTGVAIGELDAVERDSALRKSFGGKYLAGGAGKLSPKKNWGFLVRVAAYIQENGLLDIQWVIAGEGDERENLEALIGELDVADRVHLLGFRKDVLRILKSLDLLFFPSRMEGASVTVRECMVLGTPVVAVEAAGTMESLAGNGRGVPDGDVAAAAEAVVEVLTNSRLRDDYIAGARRHAVEHYTYDRTVDGTLDVYRKITAE